MILVFEHFSEEQPTKEDLKSISNFADALKSKRDWQILTPEGFGHGDYRIILQVPNATEVVSIPCCYRDALAH